MISSIKQYHASVSNVVLNSCYSLTLTERRVILLSLARVDSSKEVEAGRWYSITVEEYSRLFDVEREAAREIMIDEYKRLYDRTITLVEGKKVTNFRWVEAIQFNPEDNTVSLKWSSTIIPYISELRANFTRLVMEDVARIEGSYANRLFDLLYQEKWKGVSGRKQVSISDLVYMWQIPHSLATIGELKRVILVPAIKELERKRICKIELVNGSKLGKTITSLIFIYSFHKGNKNETQIY